MFSIPAGAVWGFVVVVIAKLKERVPRLVPGVPARVHFPLKKAFPSLVLNCKIIKPVEQNGNLGRNVDV